MKKWISFIVVFLGFYGSVMAQKFCYVDTQVILESLPEYTNSQNRLKTQTEAWQKEIEAKQENLAKVQASFEAEKILLTTEQVKEQEKKIADELKAIKELQDKRYGPNGDLVFMRRALVKPIQDQIYNATKQVADKRGYGFVFDKGSDLVMIYTDPKFDITREVINVLKPENNKDNRQTNPRANNSNQSSNSRTNTKSTPNRTKK
ncbi:MAG TPA: OmpH family outer membrane protein [Faecalibacter sp.]